MNWNIKSNTQKIWVQIDNWNYKFFIHRSQHSESLFQFEGALSHISPLTRVQVTGDIEIPEEVPPAYPGTLYLLDTSEMNLLGITLFVTPDNYASLRSVFSMAFANRRGGMGMELYLENPSSSGPEFWKEDWKKTEIPISHIGLFSGGKFLHVGDSGRDEVNDNLKK